MRLNPATRTFVEFILREVEGLRVTCSSLFLVQSALRERGRTGYLVGGRHQDDAINPVLKLTEGTMVRNKPKPEKREETTAEFVKRMSQPTGKRNGLKKQLKGARR